MVRSLLDTRRTGIATSQASMLATDTPEGPALQSRLRQKRSAAYVQAMAQLDAGGHVQSPAARQALLDAIRQELPDIAVDALPLGIVARCHLGPPHEVHTLDCSARIIRHFKSHEALPTQLEHARSLALHPGYAFVEVYATRLIAVSLSGQTALIDV